MNRTALVLAVLTGIAVAVAVTSNRGVQRERARADALAGRLAELEPIERSTHSAAARPTERVREGQPPARDLALERAEGHPAPSDAAGQVQLSQPRKTYQGSAQARKQVDRLQAALVDGTPLREYQIQALITAIDQVHSEIEDEKKARAQEASITSIDWNAESRQRLIPAAADILFESQFERFIELLNAGSDATG